MFLAREFGQADVDAFLGSISARQLDEWIALYDLEREEAERERKRNAGRR